MRVRILTAVPGRLLAAHHDGESGGGGHHATGIGAEPVPEENAARTVDATGRSTEAVCAALASLPGELARLMNDKPDSRLMEPAQDGGWGLVEILPHLRDWEVILAGRVESILEQDEPAFDELDDSLWAIEHNYREQDPREVLAEFTELRAALVERLEALEPDEWQRVGVLARQGRVTLHWLLDQFCDHDAKHLVQARDVLA